MRLFQLLPRLRVVDSRTARPAPKRADPHYSSLEHYAWREAVLWRAGYRCEAPGCTATGQLYADHIVELRDGGDPLDLANGQCLCASHHTAKTAAMRARRMVGEG